MHADQIIGVYGPYRQQISRFSIKFRVELLGRSGRKQIESFPRRVTAEAFAAKMKAMINPDRRIDFVIDRYENYMRDIRKNKPRTIESSISRLYNWLDPKQMIAEVTPLVLATKYEKRCSEAAVDTHRNELNAVKAFFRWCVKQKIISKSPAEDIEGVGKRKGRKPQLHIDEARHWVAAAIKFAEEGHDGAIAAMMSLYLGPRASEIVNSKVRDIDNDCRLYWIPDSKTPSGRRILEIPEEFQPFLRKCIEGRGREEYLFPSVVRQEGCHNRNWPRDWVRKICEAANVRMITAHGMRGLHSTLAEEYGVSPQAVAKSLGHSDIRVSGTHYTAPGTRERVRARKTASVLADKR